MKYCCRSCVMSSVTGNELLPAWNLAHASFIPPGRLTKADPIVGSSCNSLAMMQTTSRSRDKNTHLERSRLLRREGIFRYSPNEGAGRSESILAKILLLVSPSCQWLFMKP